MLHESGLDYMHSVGIEMQNFMAVLATIDVLHMYVYTYFPTT